MAFKRLDPEDFVVSSDSVTSTVWSNNSPSLNTYFSSSTQKEGTSGPYYLNVYQADSSTDERVPGSRCWPRRALSSGPRQGRQDGAENNIQVKKNAPLSAKVAKKAIRDVE